MIKSEFALNLCLLSLFLVGLLFSSNGFSSEPQRCFDLNENTQTILPYTTALKHQSEFQLIVVAKSINGPVFNMLASIDASVPDKRLETLVITTKSGAFAKDVFARFDELLFVQNHRIDKNEVFIKRNNKLMLHQRLNNMTDYQAFTNRILALVTTH